MRVQEIGGKEAYAEGIWNTTQVTGQEGTWAVPWFTEARSLYYRKDVLEKAGVDPATGQLAGDVSAQTRQILKSFMVMLEAVGSDLSHVTHINIFLQHISDFEAMNAAYVEIMGDRRPARTVIGVQELPKPGVLLTMNLTAVTKERSG